MNFEPFGGKIHKQTQWSSCTVRAESTWCVFLVCGVCGEIKLSLKPSRMSSRLFIAKSPSLSGLEAFVADLVIPRGSSASLGSPLQILKAKCRYVNIKILYYY
jgi:hypothetical protein